MLKKLSDGYLANIQCFLFFSLYFFLGWEGIEYFFKKSII